MLNSSLTVTEQGYKQEMLTKVMTEISNTSRDTLLLDKESKSADPNVIFVSEYHPSLKKLPVILKNHFHVLQNDKKLSQIFPVAPTVAFRRSKSEVPRIPLLTLRRLLVVSVSSVKTYARNYRA